MKKNKLLILLSALSVVLASCGEKPEEPKRTYVRSDIGTIGNTASNLPDDAHQNYTNVYELACDCIAYDLCQMGVDVMKGVAVVNDLLVPGFIFTNNEIASFDAASGYTVCSAGFLQIHDSTSTDDFLLTKEVIETNETPVVLVPEGSGDELITYDISLETKINPYSAIYRDRYFKYVQTDLHIVEVTVLEDKKENYDENIDLYSFETKKFVFKANPTQEKVLEAINMFSEDMVALTIACKAMQDIVNLQNDNGFKYEISTILAIDMDLIAEYAKGSVNEKLDNYITDNIDKLNLKNNEFVSITKDGALNVETYIDTEALLRERKMAGITQLLVSCLTYGLTVALCIVAPHSAGFIVTGIRYVSLGLSTLITVDSLSEAVQNIILANEGDYTTEVKGVLRQHLDNQFGEELGNFIFGTITCAKDVLSLFSSMGTLSLGNFSSQGIIKTIGHVLRVVTVKVAQDLITSTAAAISTVFAAKVMYEITGDKDVSSLVGALSGVLVGFAVDSFLDSIDEKFNISGLYSKDQLTENVEGKNRKKSGDNDNPDPIQTPKKWDDSTPDEREYSLQKMVDELSDKANLKEEPTLYFVKGGKDAETSSFDPSKNIITINVDRWDDIDSTVNSLSEYIKTADLYQNFDNLPYEAQEYLYKKTNPGSTTGDPDPTINTDINVPYEQNFKKDTKELKDYVYDDEELELTM